ncbi:MAG: hypothetical protein GXY06_01725 [Clostridiaceae bacterium]|nr:hypothetical protein [Clostridiaceae bacterium]
MKNRLTELLSSNKRVLVDYSAMIIMAEMQELHFFTEQLIDHQVELILPAFFRFQHESVFQTAEQEGKSIFVAVRDCLARVEKAELLVWTKHLSAYTFLSEFASDSSNLFIVGKKSFVLERVRDRNISGQMPVFIISKTFFKMYTNLSVCLEEEAPYSIHKVSGSDEYLDVEIHCNVGDTVYDDEGQPVLLASKISTGAEGIVFRTADPCYVAKVYHKAVITPLRWRKLLRMRQALIRAKGISWPCKLLYTFNKVPVGFTMPTAEGCTLGSAFDGPDAVISYFPDWKRIDVVNTSISILQKIIYLHLHNVLIGDIQLKNMMIKDATNVFVIDMDSVQFEDMPCPVGTEDYTPPELWDYSFSAILREPVHEDYSCGILIFSLLFCGQHPYAQRMGRETLREEMLARAFPYRMTNSEDSMVPLGGYDKIWEALPVRLRMMFVNAFSSGVRYEPAEWYDALLDYKNQLQKHAFQDEQYYELFPFTDISRVEVAEHKIGFKKSIREAIIHKPEDSASGNSSNTGLSSQRIKRDYKGSEDKIFVPLVKHDPIPTNTTPKSKEPDINLSSDSLDVKEFLFRPLTIVLLSAFVLLVILLFVVANLF